MFMDLDEEARGFGATWCHALTPPCCAGSIPRGERPLPPPPNLHRVGQVRLLVPRAARLSCRCRSKLTPLDGGAPGPAFAPMVVVGDMNSDGGSGLGLISWWAPADDAAEEEEE